ncbi:N-acetylglucosamine-6-phosphate deacetylase [Kutzneria sp. 744]|uniref:N-acetylglucosamine-6-phosphate deacetylase n=1 Tax=Kutzneria sp. (strain 744) TaxID=345341 RepID=UPI0003EEC4CC|nr:N-acetylglucosamine-6-phosphate deacetylase [Kutzneria sp. 744]EWM15061.1 N-acetylglucosamine-6-phosphate deacetylase [Kutzneria sp. 744]
MGDLVLAGGRVLTPDGVLDPGWVSVANGRIDAVGAGKRADATVDLGGSWLVPGFVDVHCHGGGGRAFTGHDPGLAIAAHRRHGTTTTIASLVSRPIKELARQIEELGDLVRGGDVAGIHLEGPFLSAARCGAHDPRVLRPPDLDSVRALLAAGEDTIKMVTIAPELEGAVEATKLLVDNGVIVAIGHTDASEAQVVPAVDAGASVATHLFNGMRPLHHREPGPIGALLDDERVSVELICDLVHLHPTAVRLAAHHAGPSRTLLITDAMAAAGMGDGVYDLGGLEVTVQDGVPTLAGGSLAGSTLTMDLAFRNFVQQCGLSMAEAVAATAGRPAQLLGLADNVGAVAVGLRADFVVLDNELRVQDVYRGGSREDRS